ncbi:MAG: hypothetical protein ACLP9L_41090 [Thermoguttaceae bacterium]
MADHFQQFSEMLPNLTAEEAAWLEEQLQPILVFGDREFCEDDPAIATLPVSDPDFTGPRFLRDDPDFDCRYDVRDFEFDFIDDQDNGTPPTRELWLYADTHGNPEHVAWLIQKFLKRFRPDQCWSLTYANTCSKPRVGEFSGGAVFVTANEIKQQTADDFVQQQRAASEKPDSSNAWRRWVLYDLDTDALLGTKVYSEYSEAVEDAAQASDILVLPLVIRGIAT